MSGGEDEHGTYGVPRAQEADEHALSAHGSAEEVSRRAQEESQSDAERDGVEGKNEQHRHENQLRRNGRAPSDLELDSGDEGVYRDSKGDRERRDMPTLREQLEHSDGRAEERAAHDVGRRPVAPLRTPLHTLARLFDQPLGLRVEDGHAT